MMDGIKRKKHTIREVNIKHDQEHIYDTARPRGSHTNAHMNNHKRRPVQDESSSYSHTHDASSKKHTDHEHNVHNDDMHYGNTPSDGSDFYPMDKSPSKFRRWMIVFFSLFLVIAASAIGLSVAFSETTIIVKPATDELTFQEVLLTATEKRSVTASTTQYDAIGDNEGKLRYEPIVETITETKILNPTERKFSKQKASGMITVYNNYTTNKQRLIKRTRFATSDGKVYRIRKSIVIPGKKGNIPGRLDVRVYADLAGDKYNLTSGTFTLIALKGKNKKMYNSITAKLKTPITGGFVGERFVVSESMKSKVRKELRNHILQRAIKEATKIASSTMYIFDGGVIAEHNDIIEQNINNKLKLTQTSKITYISFKKRDFADALISSASNNGQQKGYAIIKNIEKLRIKVDKESFETVDDNVVKILINGNAEFVWLFDKEQLKRDLLGKDIEVARVVLKSYSMIKHADIIFRPPWSHSLPKNPNDITITITGYDDEDESGSKEMR
jgi:hypothetical protein